MPMHVFRVKLKPKSKTITVKALVSSMTPSGVILLFVIPSESTCPIRQVVPVLRGTRGFLYTQHAPYIYALCTPMKIMSLLTHSYTKQSNQPYSAYHPCPMTFLGTRNQSPEPISKHFVIPADLATKQQYINAVHHQGSHGVCYTWLW